MFLFKKIILKNNFQRLINFKLKQKGYGQLARDKDYRG